MDANQTRFQLLLGYPDWSACQDSQLGTPLGAEWASTPPHHSQVEWDPERQELILRPRLFKFKPAPKDNAPSLDDRRGAGRDRFGNWYWIDGSRQQVLVNSSGSGATTVFWPIQMEEPAPDRTGSFRQRDLEPPPAVQLFSGLAVTEDHYLVVGLLQPPGLLVFDLHAGGPPQTLAWPPSVDFIPFDMSPRPGGGVWILDRQHRRLWGLDRRFNPDGPPPATPGPDAFQPLAGPLAGGAVHSTAPLSFPSGFSLELSSPLDAHDPVSVETLPDDSVLVLDRLDNSGLSPLDCYSTVALYRCGQQVGQPVSLAGCGRPGRNGRRRGVLPARP